MSSLFSSPVTNEGKTFTSCNYAVSLAQQGLRTLLIDATCAAPRARALRALREIDGLIEHVSLNVAWDEVVQRGVIENLDILLPGVKTPNPAEFLSGDGLKDVIRQALTKYDRIVLDSPPVNAVSDTLLIAPYVQTICLVIRAKMTPAGAVDRALSLLRMARSGPSVSFSTASRPTGNRPTRCPSTITPTTATAGLRRNRQVAAPDVARLWTIAAAVRGVRRLGWSAAILLAGLASAAETAPPPQPINWGICGHPTWPDYADWVPGNMAKQIGPGARARLHVLPLLVRGRVLSRDFRHRRAARAIGRRHHLPILPSR